MNPLTKHELIDVLENSTFDQLRALRALRRAEQRPAPTEEPSLFSIFAV